jgi:outer membrane protein assembly factor BamA
MKSALSRYRVSTESARAFKRMSALAGGVFIVAALGSPAVHAQDAANAKVGDTSGQPGESDTELTAVPIAGGDSDVGIGGGVIASLAEVAENVDPYWWRLEAVGMLTGKPSDGNYDIRYVDTYLMLRLPHVIRNRLGLTLRASYTKESDLSYYGIGNRSELTGGRGENDPYYGFDWTHPKAEGLLELALVAGFELVAGLSYSHNVLSVPPDGKLVEDSQSDNEDLRQLTRLLPEYGVAMVSAGLNWDTRDDEVAPERGYYHTIRVDYSPGGSEQLPYRFMRSNIALRQYLPLLPQRLTFAARLMVDALFGQPPFYELARFDNTFAIGGGRGLRGIPAPRYYGMFKLLANLELRVRVLTFDLFDKPHELGLVAFTDLGRVVANYDSLSELDGPGLGMKVAYGGGVRLRAGESFVLRVDMAGSKAEGSFSAYLAAGHLF